MKTNLDPEEDALLAAVLGDESWQAANCASKTQAIGVFQRRQNLRRWGRRAGAMAVLAVLTFGAARWLTPPVPARMAVTQTAPPAAPIEKANYLTDEQLLALFPPGSCFLAEVDGKKKLVFFDPKVEHEYISEAGAARSFGP